MILKCFCLIFCVAARLQVVDEAETAEPEQTEPLHSTPDRDADDSKTDQTEEPRDEPRPRSLEQNTEKVMPLKSNLDDQTYSAHFITSVVTFFAILEGKDEQDKQQGKMDSVG